MGNGSSQAGRKLSVENPDPSTVIKVSENVVQRIRSGAAAEAENELKEETYREVEDELQKNNQYWEKRIKALQESQKKINQIMEEEYLRSVEQIKKELPNLPPEHLSIPCVEKKGKLLSCYKAYQKRPLLCAQEVEAFNSCMNNERVRILNKN